MRVTAIFLLGISTLGCKDKEAPKQQSAATAPMPQNAQPKVATPEPPKLQEPTEDMAAWGKEMESQLPKIAPQLTGVKCEPKKCAATLSGANEQALDDAVSELENSEPLQAVGAKHVLLSGSPEQKDGKMSVTVYVQF